MTEFPAAPPVVEPSREWGRLDPRMIIVRPLNELMGLLIPVFILMFAGNGDTWRIVAGGATVGALVLYGLFSWVSTKYRITETQVELHKGLLHRQRLAIPRDRIRTVDLTAKLGHRLFGLSAVRVGTGEQSRTATDGVILDAVTAQEADRLRQVFLRRSTAAEPTVGEDDSTPISHLDKRWYRYAPLTMSGLLTIGLTAGFGMNLARELNLEFSDAALVRSVFRWVLETSPLAVIPAVAGLVLVVSILLSLLAYLLQNHDFRLTRNADGTVRVRRGLLTTRSVSVEEQRLRGVSLHEPLLLRAGRGARLTAVTTGLGRASGSSLLLPPAPRAEAHRVAERVLLADPTSADLTRHPARARTRRLVRAVGPNLVVAGVLALLAGVAGWPHWLWIVAACLVPVSVLLGLDRYRNLGHALTDRYLVSRSGSLDRETVALQRTGIIGWKIEQTLFQRRAGLLSVTAITAAGKGGYTVVDVGESNGLKLADAAIPDLLRPFLRTS
ncbi:putative membrane protein [Actinokineospora alba]|uniref:Putative membrane protein n=1 Tax=Actinokineospora alba TaxID=504798 RepID=A0A1H0W3G8_9PSEU|nr:PH domain-containing protein [Actinokineospora alba]TDP67799.1 putative membrane protein [Actinokineospora alba]SDI72080.1 putative membrane protein [Actinokineospora alba]SDP84886.1 putative membrane protein [Actinokineospora alba]